MSERLFLQFPDINDTDTDQVHWFHVSDNQIRQSGSQSVALLSELKEQYATQ